MAELHSTFIDSSAPGRYGAAGSGLVLGEKMLFAAYNVQGDPSRAALVDEAKRALGVTLPRVPNSTTTSTAGSTAFWLGPTSWLLVRGASSPAIDFNATRNAINAAGGALFDVSASRVAFSVSGDVAVSVLGAFCPLDFHVRAFSVGACAQSLLGPIGSLFYRCDEREWALLVPRSYARDAWHSLSLAALPHGYEVIPTAPFG